MDAPWLANSGPNPAVPLLIVPGADPLAVGTCLARLHKILTGPARVRVWGCLTVDTSAGALLNALQNSSSATHGHQLMLYPGGSLQRVLVGSVEFVPLFCADDGLEQLPHAMPRPVHCRALNRSQ